MRKFALCWPDYEIVQRVVAQIAQIPWGTNRALLDKLDIRESRIWYAYDVALISNNTRHVWYIHSVELKDRDFCLTYHKHYINHPYHNHSRCGTLRRAIRSPMMNYLFSIFWQLR